jgi:hypothetical protein
MQIAITDRFMCLLQIRERTRSLTQIHSHPKKILNRSGFFRPLAPTRLRRGKADGETMQLMLILCLFNPAHVPEDTLKGVQKQVDEIYRHAGIGIEWRMGVCPPVAGEEQVLTATLVLSTECVTAKTCGQRSILGTAMRLGGSGMRRAYVYADRVMDTSWSFQKDRLIPGIASLLLSMTIAHEVGHLLLPEGYGHAPKGIMAERLDLESIFTAKSGELFFSRAQEDLIRNAFRSATSSGWPSS